MKTYLVTGAAGFIGANFVKYMLKKYEDIHIFRISKCLVHLNFLLVQDHEHKHFQQVSVYKIQELYMNQDLHQYES